MSKREDSVMVCAVCALGGWFCVLVAAMIGGC